jgi:3-oxoacyl-[acyl-carrier protein] reductase
MGKNLPKNVLAAGRLIHHMVPAMSERGWGRIIQIGTMSGTLPTSGQPEYGPSKAALLNMCLGLSKAMAGSGVTVNTISPSLIRTPGIGLFLSKFAEKRGWDDVIKAEKYVTPGHTVGRVGEVENVGYAVAYLASPIADFVNGVNIHMDGGAYTTVH